MSENDDYKANPISENEKKINEECCKEVKEVKEGNEDIYYKYISTNKQSAIGTPYTPPMFPNVQSAIGTPYTPMFPNNNLFNPYYNSLLFPNSYASQSQQINNNSKNEKKVDYIELLNNRYKNESRVENHYYCPHNKIFQREKNIFECLICKREIFINKDFNLEDSSDIVYDIKNRIISDMEYIFDIYKMICSKDKSNKDFYDNIFSIIDWITGLKDKLEEIMNNVDYYSSIYTDEESSSGSNENKKEDTI